MAAALSHQSLKNAWTNTVRHGLRRQLIGDLHDYLDVHRRLKQLAPALHAEVRAGGYRPRRPEFVTLEKDLGITRRVVIPSPRDGIVLQALIDGIEQQVLAPAPTDSAFYSRSHAPPSVYDIDSTFPYPWWELWPEFQQRIWEFAKGREYVVMTDVANYFDAIPLQMLRNRLTSIAHLREELVDFLFVLLEGMGWRPDYIPSTGVGLPQIQFDAPRLLAHSYLFEADGYLKRAAKVEFVRWMDDINVGVDSMAEGKKILRNLDEMLTTMGVRLNAGKTKILTGEEAVSELWLELNRKLNTVDNVIESGNLTGRAALYTRRQFDLFYSEEERGAWKKILRRFISTFTKLSDPHIVPIAPALLRSYPATRDKVFNYYKVLGYSGERLVHLAEFLKSGHCLDDAGTYGALEVITSWEIPAGTERDESLALAAAIVAGNRDSHIALGGALALVAKWAPPSQVLRFIWDNRRTWRRSEWASRQVAAVSPVLDSADAHDLSVLLGKYGSRDGMDVMIHLQELRRRRNLDQQLRSYLLQPQRHYPYPFPKVLIAMALLRGQLDLSERQEIYRHFDVEVRDRRYHELVRSV